MAQEITFRSPDSYEREIDRSTSAPTGPVGTPAGVIGTANKGPAFVPVTVGNFDEFVQVFGDLDPKKMGPYAANEFLKNRSALTYLRVLGAGSNTTDAHISTTLTSGRVNGAGFKLEGNAAGDNRHNGCVQFIVGRHTVQANESFGMPMFTDNDSYSGSAVSLVRGVVMLASGARLMVLDGNQSAVSAFTSGDPNDDATLSNGKFKLVISSSLGTNFASTDGNSGVRILTASFNPTDVDYFAKVLNRDPDRFVQDQHYLHADFAIDDEIAFPTTVGVLSGSTNTSTTSGEPSTTFRAAFGGYDTRFQVPKTTKFISQPFGATEYDLFHVEALDDGEFANKLYKIAISNIKASTDESNLFGTFTLEVRDFNDTDANPVILERYPLCTLNPNDDNYVARVVGDRHVTYNFDTTVDSEKRVIATGKYPNVSSRIRVVMSQGVEEGTIPQNALPFGFRGFNALKTNDSLNDVPGTNVRLSGVLTGAGADVLSGSIVPPVPFRYKVTRGSAVTPAWPGDPGPTELTNQALYWGVKFERNNSPLNANVSSEKNEIISAFTKFVGIQKLDTLVTGSGADRFNNNKFSLSRVTLSNTSLTDLTASVNDHMREAAYIRNGKCDTTDYRINDGALGSRVTMATILAKDSAATFNRFIGFNKFVNFMYGGYDGVNFLDADARKMNDKATSFDSGGGASSEYVAPGMLVNPAGSGQNNSTVVSYDTALRIMTEKQNVNHNLIVLPGIREPFLTDLAAQRTKSYELAFYIMDIPSYDESGTRLFDDDGVSPDVEQTANAFDSRVIDNNYVGTYYSDCFIDDERNNRRVKVPASVVALGAIAFNDRIAYPWFAPAGFNRAALDFVKNVEVRLSSPERDRLSDSRINPIATFPRQGFVIYGQKTLQINRSALDRVNVRRMLLEVKRSVINVAKGMIFEANTPALRNKFVSDVRLHLGLIQAQQGIQRFQVVCNETNNTAQDIQLNRMNARIVVSPIRTAEFIQLDFVITNSGVEFTS